MKAVTIVGWSQAGRLEDLEKTALRKLGDGPRGPVRLDDTLLIETDDPVAVARRLTYLPGVSWISVGYRFKGTRGYVRNLEGLAKRYLSRGKSFNVSAHVARSKLSAGDVVLAGNSALLSAIPGSKVSERRPQVKFHVCLEGAAGACGAEIRTGPGGIPTGSQWISCLVSGGERSSSLAWMSALSGFSLRLIHARIDETSLRQVARLYSELSFRMYPGSLELLILDRGGSAMGRIGRHLLTRKGEVVFAGARPAPEELVRFASIFPNLSFPLTLVQDDSVSTIYRSLGIGRAAQGPRTEILAPEALQAGSPSYSERRFGGIEADPNTVIDSLKRDATSLRRRARE